MSVANKVQAPRLQNGFDISILPFCQSFFADATQFAHHPQTYLGFLESQKYCRLPVVVMVCWYVGCHSRAQAPDKMDTASPIMVGAAAKNSFYYGTVSMERWSRPHRILDIYWDWSIEYYIKEGRSSMIVKKLLINPCKVWTRYLERWSSPISQYNWEYSYFHDLIHA